jgi:glycosyltransferase involved in cell wall biosynthesis
MATEELPQSPPKMRPASQNSVSTIARGVHTIVDSPPTVSVVVPAKNEGENVEWVLEAMPRWVAEVVLVDGNSTDDTVERALKTWPDLVLVGQDRPGKGAAIREGFASATGEIVVMIDADGSMDPGELDRYVKPLIDGDCDMVKGSRWLPGGGSTDITPFRRLGNQMLLALVNALFRSDFTELCYGFMAFKRTCFGCLDLTADGFEIETQIVVNAVKAGLRVKEVPSIEASRRHGRSNLRPVRDGIRVLRTVVESLRTPVARAAGTVLAPPPISPQVETIAAAFHSRAP